MVKLIQLESLGVTYNYLMYDLWLVNVSDVDYEDIYFESCISESVSKE